MPRRLAGLSRNIASAAARSVLPEIHHGYAAYSIMHHQKVPPHTAVTLSWLLSPTIVTISSVEFCNIPEIKLSDLRIATVCKSGFIIITGLEFFG
jgi:hypothetical protein